MTRAHGRLIFWGCFVALITTAFAFVGRLFLINEWAAEFGLDPAQAGRLAGIGIWPFAVSIIGFSLIIDRIGYKTAMYIGAAGHLLWAAMGVAAYVISRQGDTATAFLLIYWGSLIVALANGTIEAFINPVVATMFRTEKTKWLNILHAGWPGGLVLAGVIVIFLGEAPWWLKVGVIALPTLVYFGMLARVQFPRHEREVAGVSYRDMLREFGVAGAVIVMALIALQLMDFFPQVHEGWFIALAAAAVLAFWLYTRALGNGLLFVLILIMFPLATTELGTDGWITGIMESVARDNSFHPGWVLVYTSAIMLVLRFFAGPIVHKLSALGLLAASAALAIVGLYTLSFTQGLAIFAAATLYGVGKTFFWPTMLGVVAEQTPKGGALTLNAVSGIGMLAVGTLGLPYIGVLQTMVQNDAVAQSAAIAEAIPGLVANGELTALQTKTIYEVLQYQTLDPAAVDALIQQLAPAQQADARMLLEETRARSNQGALAYMTIFPAIMLVCYLGLMVYFRSKGGYRPIQLLDPDEPSRAGAAGSAALRATP